MRAMLADCAPTWSTQPKITSSISAGSAPVRATSSSSTNAPRSIGCQLLSLPLLAAAGRPDRSHDERLGHRPSSSCARGASILPRGERPPDLHLGRVERNRARDGALGALCGRARDRHQPARRGGRRALPRRSRRAGGVDPGRAAVRGRDQGLRGRARGVRAQRGHARADRLRGRGRRGELRAPGAAELRRAAGARRRVPARRRRAPRRPARCCSSARARRAASTRAGRRTAPARPRSTNGCAPRAPSRSAAADAAACSRWRRA